MKELLRSNPITMNDWLKYHPYTKISQVDYYYLKLCNKLLKANINEPLVREIKWSEYKDLTCILVCWFEDVISETNIWRSFTAEHKRLYGNFLPFYDTVVNYYDDEINLQDIRFLIWHFFSIINEDILINPFRLIFNFFAAKAYELFEKEYETAPQNLPFKEKLLVPTYREFFETRLIMEFLTFQSYLNFHYAKRKMKEKMENVDKHKHEPKYDNILRYDSKVNFLIEGVSPILALRANEQLANIIGKNHPKYHNIKNISKRHIIKCIVKDYTDTHLLLEHIASGQHINLALDTLAADFQKNSIQRSKYLVVTVVKWGDEWALMGSLIGYNTEDKTLTRELKDDEKYIFDPLEPKLEMLTRHEECFKDLTGGSLLAYFSNTDQYVEFAKRFIVHIFEKANPEERYPNDNLNKMDFGDHDLEDIVLFFNHHSGTELYPNLTFIVNDPRNPYYDPDEAADIQLLITEKTISPQFVKYLVENEMITFDRDKNMDDQTIKDNLDFLLRYFKTGDYYSEPRITLI